MNFKCSETFAGGKAIQVNVKRMAYGTLATVTALTSVIGSAQVVSAGGTTTQTLENGAFQSSYPIASSYTEHKVAQVAAKEEKDSKVSIAVAMVDTAVYESLDDEDASGMLYDSNVAQVVSFGANWTEIQSGDVSGFVSTANLCFDEEAQALAVEAGNNSVDDLSFGLTNAQIEEKEAEEAAAAEAAAAAEEEAKASRAAESDVQLLAAIIEREAGNQSWEGKVAVGNAVLNRVAGGYWGSSIASVIYAPGQFTGAASNGGPSAAFAALLNRGASSDCVAAARAALVGENYIGGRTSFRSTQKYSASSYAGSIIVGDHVFF